MESSWCSEIAEHDRSLRGVLREREVGVPHGGHVVREGRIVKVVLLIDGGAICRTSKPNGAREDRSLQP